MDDSKDVAVARAIAEAFAEFEELRRLYGRELSSEISYRLDECINTLNMAHHVAGRAFTQGVLASFAKKPPRAKYPGITA